MLITVAWICGLNSTRYRYRHLPQAVWEHLSTTRQKSGRSPDEIMSCLYMLLCSTTMLSIVAMYISESRLHTLIHDLPPSAHSREHLKHAIFSTFLAMVCNSKTLNDLQMLGVLPESVFFGDDFLKFDRKLVKTVQF